MAKLRQGEVRIGPRCSAPPGVQEAEYRGAAVLRLAQRVRRFPLRPGEADEEAGARERPPETQSARALNH